MKHFLFAMIVLLLLPSGGCASPKPMGIGNADPASYGMAKRTLEKGVTTQQTVLETFGAPNITTKGTGEVAEVWTYEKVSSEYVASQTGVGGGFGVAAVPGNASHPVPLGGVLTGSYNKQKGASSVRTVTLIIKFDQKEIVSDYKIMETNF